MSAVANRSTRASAKRTCCGRFIDSSGPRSQLLARRRVDLRIRIAEQERPEGHQVVDVLVPVDVGDPAAAAALDVHRRALGRREHPPGQVVGARDDALGAREPLAGRGVAFFSHVFAMAKTSIRRRTAALRAAAGFDAHAAAWRRWMRPGRDRRILIRALVCPGPRRSRFRSAGHLECRVVATRSTVEHCFLLHSHALSTRFSSCRAFNPPRGQPLRVRRAAGRAGRRPGFHRRACALHVAELSARTARRRSGSRVRLSRRCPVAPSLARRRPRTHRRRLPSLSRGAAERRAATLLLLPLACPAPAAVGGTDQAGRRRLALRRAAPLGRCSACAADPHLPRGTRLRIGRAEPRRDLPPAPCSQRLRRAAGAHRRALHARRDPALAGPPCERVPARGDRLQPRLRATAAAPADHGPRACGARHRSDLLHAARDGRQRVHRTCAQGVRRAGRHAAARAAARPTSCAGSRSATASIDLGIGTVEAVESFDLERELVEVLAAKAEVGADLHSDSVPHRAAAASRHGLQTGAKHLPCWRASRRVAGSAAGTTPRRAASGACCTTSGRRCSACSAATKTSCCATGSPPAARRTATRVHEPRPARPRPRRGRRVASPALRRHLAGLQTTEDGPPDEDADCRALEGRLLAASSKREAMALLHGHLSPANHYKPAGLLATRLYAGIFDGRALRRWPTRRATRP